MHVYAYARANREWQTAIRTVGESPTSVSRIVHAFLASPSFADHCRRCSRTDLHTPYTMPGVIRSVESTPYHQAARQISQGCVSSVPPIYWTLQIRAANRDPVPGRPRLVLPPNVGPNYNTPLGYNFDNCATPNDGLSTRSERPSVLAASTGDRHSPRPIVNHRPAGEMQRMDEHEAPRRNCTISLRHSKKNVLLSETTLFFK